MSELTKTSLYFGAALLIAGLAFFTRPGPIGEAPPVEEGTPLFPDFTDPYEATSMRIVRYDESLGQISNFEVAQKAGQWVIPSHEDYPADAKDQLKEAATALIDLRVIGVVSELAGDHGLYGVIQPDAEKTEVGEKGVGTFVSMKDAKANDLADLIIGKAVKDVEGQYYVRVPGRDRVYTVKIDPQKFSTKFEDWIEKDLLGLSAFDIKQIELKDYSLTVGPTGRASYDQRLDMAVTWNSDDFKWELDSLQEGHNGQLQPAELGPDEELNKETLDGLKDALDELQIVDVERKPAGLRADLKADADFMASSEAQQSLGNRGFYVVMVGPDQHELLSSDGEVQVRTKDGVEYVLRFGQIAGVATGAKDEQGKLNRYVFVTARVDENNFPPPEYEQVPEAAGEPAPPPPLSDKQDQAGANPANATEDAANDDPAAKQANKDEASKSADQDTGAAKDAVEGKTADDQAGGKDASDEAANKDDAASDQPAGDKASQDEAKQDKSAETSDKADQAKDDQETERDRIIKENERKRKEYEDKKKKAEDKVKELNFRFADWYYVISEDVYKKIHLSRTDVVKKKEKSEEEKKKEAEEAATIDSFRQIEQEGLKADDGDKGTSP